MKKSVVTGRLLAALLACAAAAVVVLLGVTSGTAAGAAPYPPTNPCTSSATSSPSLGIGDSPAPSGSCSHNIAPTSAHRTSTVPNNPSHSTDSDHTKTASTGFDSLVASLVALALLGGGAIFLLAGRKRRHG